ncbi:MAG: polysaccharide biosynthesis C-terminal domain-containing protein, partial [Clostridia bacterium]|nr:polysaccharide biosynthesis C-terminal domain-containing protein [Clostridia bacterium]
KPLLREMLAYSLPMIPTVIAWWVMQLSDKYMVVLFCGLAASGIYSVSYKIPSILSTVTSIFTNAWQISAFENQAQEDYSAFVTVIYRWFVVANVMICAFLITGSKLLGVVLFQKEYFIAWTYVPILLLAYLFSGLSGLLASVFSAAKNTKPLFHSTVVGASLNIVLNFIFIPKYGAMAAAYTTLVGFLATWLVRMWSCRKFVKIKATWGRDIIAFLLLMTQSVTMCIDYAYKYIVCALVILLLFFIYRALVFQVLTYPFKKITKRTGN